MFLEMQNASALTLWLWLPSYTPSNVRDRGSAVIIVTKRCPLIRLADFRM